MFAAISRLDAKHKTKEKTKEELVDGLAKFIQKLGQRTFFTCVSFGGSGVSIFCPQFCSVLSYVYLSVNLPGIQPTTLFASNKFDAEWNELFVQGEHSFPSSCFKPCLRFTSSDGDEDWWGFQNSERFLFKSRCVLTNLSSASSEVQPLTPWASRVVRQDTWCTTKIFQLQCGKPLPQRYIVWTYSIYSLDEAINAICYIQSSSE